MRIGESATPHMPAKINDGLTRYQRYYRRNTSKMRAKVRQWRAANPERTKRIERASYARNIDQRRADAREDSKNYRAKIVGTDAYRAAERARKQLRRARLAGVAATLTEAEWQLILATHDHRCAYCGIKPGRIEQDHVVPIVRGGTHTAANVVPACKPCNSSKRDRDRPTIHAGRSHWLWKPRAHEYV